MSDITDIGLIRLLQLCSSALPIGSFTYSQGLEWAVECQWISTEQDLQEWLSDLIHTNLQQLEIPILVKMSTAIKRQDLTQLTYWTHFLMAHRETSELRLEEHNRGRAMARLLNDLDLPVHDDWKNVLAQTQTASFAAASTHWEIPIAQSCQGFAWSWLENIVLSGVKLIPLGQVAGQRILLKLTPLLTTAVNAGLKTNEENIGSSSPALAYASARHETQYTRLFRS